MHKRIEELTLNGWPALYSSLHEGWLLRFADGYTKRANSVSPLYGSADTDNADRILERIEYCESLYKQAGQAAIFKITPFGGTGMLDDRLEQLGYDKADVSSVQTRSLLQLKEPHTREVTIADAVQDDWLSVLSEMTGMAEQARVSIKKILSSGSLQKGFFTLYEGGVSAAVGVGVIEQGYVGLYDIVVAESYRNKGLGEQLILNILKWAKNNGAAHSYLQVVKGNGPAIRLYEKLGYEEIYTYWYRAKA